MRHVNLEFMHFSTGGQGNKGFRGESSETFFTRICTIPRRSHDDQRDDSFLKQRFSMALQIGKGACVLGTVATDAFDITYIFF